MSVYKAFLGDQLEPDPEGRQGAQGDLSTPGSFTIPLLSSQVRQESVGSEAQETRGTAEVGEKALKLPGLEHNAEGQVSSNVDRDLIGQVAVLQNEIKHLQQQLQLQKGCNDLLLELATDGNTRERFLEVQVQDLETKLFRSEDLREQWLAEHLQKTDGGVEEKSKGFQEAER